MKHEKKHIDRLFQEGLKNFEATPSNTVWKNVSEQLLNNQKQRKVIPLWMKISAIAAGLLLLFTLGNNLFFQDNNPNPEIDETIVDTNSKNNDSNTLDPNNIDNLNKNNNTNEKLAQEESNFNDNDTKDSLNSNKKNSKNTLINKNESIVAKNDEGANSSKNKRLNAITKDELIKEATANTVASSNSNKTKVDDSQKNAVKDDISKITDINSAVVKNQSTNKIESEKSNKIDGKSTETTVADVNKIDKEINEAGKISIEDAIAENKIKETEDELNEDEVAKRWSVAPNIAPVYFNSLGTGSSMDSEFVNNAKSGEINMSYGVSASYAINDKINVRVGVNNVKLGYNTHDVFNASDMEMNPIKPIAVKNIEIDKTPTELAFITVAGMSFAQVPEPLSNQYNASINQELGFLEIPLEIQYNITNTKLGINAIGGFSALFLNTNDIYSTLDGTSTLIGKATNINNLSYSANLGLGLNYKVSNNINVNLEPMFKYQLNTFRNTSGNFKPYFIGVYSGLSFKF
ncbi:outer membrane beta-barrel protein [Flavobacteriaceae bacterium S0825]|uniref:outer membrane beta-barrel protein n=1 Tax=Gaetbulibacter sp. S0825 TaxID=2720084 RepID=UPI00142FDA6A|nr:outer membrane beta-barrel protein [Gaetbulibacter sp. S0825]MCK0108335.1 outer membrane beta-barrel protein [Flavobacteriaceae bacterium S0825]NIX63971.1 PorT family protein [Gaetbulibacter sp. S0825]